jgi:hypothetical protein
MFNRYKEGAFFKPHYDGMYKSGFGDCSIYTVTIYLNDSFEGGRLIFRKSKEEVENVLNVFQPQTGTAILFNHDTLHEGEVVEKGTKYLLRTSVMFRRVSDLSDAQKKYREDPEWQFLHETFRRFDELNAEGDAQKFTTTFLKVQQLQLAKNRSIREPPPSILSRDSLIVILTYLNNLKDIASFSLVCHAYWQAARSSVFLENTL